MSETWRDTINDAIRDYYMNKYTYDFSVANDKARNLCDAIFDALEIESELQDVSWDVIARTIKGRDFSIL